MSLKYYIKLLSISTFTISCNSRFAVKNTREIEKLQINEDRYIGKSINKVINDLKVNIISISAILGNHDSNNVLALRFYTKSDYNNLKKWTSKVEPAYVYIFLSERNNSDDKLFVNPSPNPNDSTGQYLRTFMRNDKLSNNRKLLKSYRKFTVSHIYANSEQEKK